MCKSKSASRYFSSRQTLCVRQPSRTPPKRNWRASAPDLNSSQHRNKGASAYSRRALHIQKISVIIHPQGPIGFRSVLALSPTARRSHNGSAGLKRERAQRFRVGGPAGPRRGCGIFQQENIRGRFRIEPVSVISSSSRPYRLSARTDPSHGSKRGSIPRRVTKRNFPSFKFGTHARESRACVRFSAQTRNSF